jgi:hypothetical protein
MLGLWAETLINFFFFNHPPSPSLDPVMGAGEFFLVSCAVGGNLYAYVKRNFTPAVA